MSHLGRPQFWINTCNTYELLFFLKGVPPNGMFIKVIDYSEHPFKVNDLVVTPSPAWMVYKGY